MHFEASGSSSERDSTVQVEKDKKKNIEKIVIKPSTELIPDEYEHNTNKNAYIHIFKTSVIKNKKAESKFLDMMTALDYEIPHENRHPLDRANDVKDTLGAIALGCEGKSMLMILFIGSFQEYDQHIFKLPLNEELEIRDIWRMFTIRNCPQLANKPKVFMFVDTKYRMLSEADGVQITRSERVFEVVIEADMLIIHKRNEDDDVARFVETFCDNTLKYGKNEDVMSLLTQTTEAYIEQPIIISTLTRKLYLTPSNIRGNHLQIRDIHEDVTYKLKNIEDVLAVLQEDERHKKERKDNVSRWQKFTKIFTNNNGNKVTSTDTTVATNSIDKSTSSTAAKPQPSRPRQRAESLAEYDIQNTRLPERITKNKKLRSSSISGKPPWKY